jgi:hypothetical protein
VQEHRAGGRHCLYRPESGAGHQVTLNGRPDPPRLAPRAGSSSNEPCSIPFKVLTGVPVRRVPSPDKSNGVSNDFNKVR